MLQSRTERSRKGAIVDDEPPIDPVRMAEGVKRIHEAIANPLDRASRRGVHLGFQLVDTTL
jgi:hypothetical protein